MIDKIYIESAKNIRKEFLSLSEKLDNYQSDLNKYVSYLETASVDLESIKNNDVKKMREASDLKDITEKITKKLNEIETEEQKIIHLIRPINDRIEKLREEENYLYGQIKEKYPKLSDEEIIKEIHSYLEK
jgi:chromosome segregation ATPase